MFKAVNSKSYLVGGGLLKTKSLDILDTSNSEFDMPINANILESADASLSTSKYGCNTFKGLSGDFSAKPISSKTTTKDFCNSCNFNNDFVSF